MPKFEAGDRIIQTGSGRMATVIKQYDDSHTESYEIQSDDSYTGTSMLCNLAIWELVERGQKLPEMPESVMYRSTMHELEVRAESTFAGDVFIGVRKQWGDEDFRGLHLTADEALQLSHDILRYAMKAKRKEKEEA